MSGNLENTPAAVGYVDCSISALESYDTGGCPSIDVNDQSSSGSTSLGGTARIDMYRMKSIFSHSDAAVSPPADILYDEELILDDFDMFELDHVNVVGFLDAMDAIDSIDDEETHCDHLDLDGLFCDHDSTQSNSGNENPLSGVSHSKGCDFPGSGGACDATMSSVIPSSTPCYDSSGVDSVNRGDGSLDHSGRPSYSMGAIGSTSNFSSQYCQQGIDQGRCVQQQCIQQVFLQQQFIQQRCDQGRCIHCSYRRFCWICNNCGHGRLPEDCRKCLKDSHKKARCVFFEIMTL